MKLMQNIIILVAVLFAATNIIFAKNYTLVPNDTIFLIGELEDLQTLTIQQLNISKDTINLKWKLIKSNLPENWEASVCDNSFCYTSLVESGIMTPIFPDDYGFILLHITPKIKLGESVIQYAVWDDSKPSEIDTLTFILKVEKTTNAEFQLEPMVYIYPNPTNDILNISNTSINNSSYTITDILSKQVQSGLIFSNINQVSLINLSTGLYFLEIKDNKGKIQFIKPIIKN